MAEPYVKKDPGDIIRAQDWNDMQSRVRGALEVHAHTGDGQGPLLTGAAIDPASALKVKSLAAETLSVAGADLSGSLKALLDKVNAALPLGGGILGGEVTARGGLRLAEAEIWLRRAGDPNHGLGWYGADKRFAGQAPDGPILYGWSGGGLGSTGSGGQRLALTWDAQQNVSVGKALTVADSITAAGSDLYFTQTDHTHTARGNTAGFAAIENAKDYDALMILGRSGAKLPNGDTGRYVRVWDYLQVDGDLAARRSGRGGLVMGTWRKNESYGVLAGLQLDQNDEGNYALLVGNNGADTGRTFLNSPLDIRFRIANSDKMVLQKDGKVGIGTSAPQAQLQVANGAIMPSAGDSEGAGILFPPDAFGGGGDRAWIRWVTRGGESTTLEIGTANDPDDHIALNPSGNVGIGTRSPAFKLDVAGAIRCQSLIPVSDVRLKTDIRPLDIEPDFIERLEPVTYRWAEPAASAPTHVGFVAQQVRSVLPQLVLEGSDGILAIDQAGLTAALALVLRAHQAEIAALKARIATA